ncbi:MAG TPA: flagellar biosynthesis protein FlhF [Roseburia sp.]|jgi:flagellar biosynthesis protein FlhF|nr:flagellar biosynthesis protein FlhF [Roseburia sp.]
MTINKFQGRTREEAIDKAKKEMGEAVVIMNVKEVKPKGLFRALKSTTYEVTAALEEKEQAVNPLPALHAPLKMHDSINFAANEKIEIPVPEPVATPVHPETSHDLEEKIESLSNLLEKKLKPEKEAEHHEEAKPEKEAAQPKDMKHQQSETFRCIRMIYETLLDNEVNERYVNQILDDVEKNLRGSASMDIILSNVYQKMVLKFGQPQKIELVPGQPKVVFFIGPTGVGKTTTIAKVASKFKVDYGKKVAFLTADTYRIAAAEQLRTYANILDTPLTVIYSPEEMNAAIERVKDYDLVLVDTAGFSYKNEEQRKDMKHLIESLDEKYEKDVYLVLSATTKYRDLIEIVDNYHEISDYKIIFTKLDETSGYGSLLNIRMYSGADVSYVTTGQNVPDDIEVFQSQKIVKQLLGGR